ncbi:tRNA pseudouridine(38-40) synthase TruA [Mycoplasmatota bacterium]|nr:tRNA pseudouridine(38-40) synthase TruA [Mycoplasmatota bacterium]
MSYRIKCIVSYDGCRFSGYQRQIKERTVQAEIEKALKIIHKYPITIHSAGRTDAFVHALGQVFHFDTELDIKNQNWKRAINSILPKDIYIKEVEIVTEDFHARFSAKRKEYRYYISLDEYNPIRSGYVCFINRTIDVNKMKQALKLFEGTHDFTSFSSGQHVNKNKVRTIYETQINVKDKELEFVFIGNGFLRYQIRIMMGTIIEIGLGKKDIDVINYLFGHKDRAKARYTAEPQGLYLCKVDY